MRKKNAYCAFKCSHRGQKAATYTLCGGDVNIAADEGQTVVHAHL